MTGQPLRVLLLDENPDDRSAIMRALRREFPNLHVEQITDAETFEHYLETGKFDVVITEYQLSWTDGLSALRTIKDAQPSRPVVMFTDAGNEEIAVAAMKAGVDDYLPKSPRNLDSLPPVIRMTIEQTQHSQMPLNRNARLSQSENQQSRTLSLLVEVSHIVATSLNADALLKDVAESIGRHFGYPAVRLFTLDNEGQTLVLRGYSGISANSPKPADPEVRQQPIDRNIIACANHIGNSHAVSDATTDHPYRPADLMPAQAEVCIPILDAGNLSGVIEVESDHETDFDERTLSLLETVADTVSIGLRNARLYEESQRRLQELTLLSRIPVGFGAGLNFDSLIDGTLKGLHELVNADRTYFVTIDPETLAWERVHAQAAPGIEPRAGLAGTFADMPVELNRLSTGKPFAVFDTMFDPRVDKTREMYQSQGTQSTLLVPVQFGKRLYGALGCDCCREKHAWRPDEIRLLEAVARQLELALDNLHLFEEVRLRAEELAAALNRLEELDRLKDKFIQNVSHELRSPLAIIHGYVEMLKTGELGELQSEQEKPVAIIARRVRMLSDLVQDITLILQAEVSPPTSEAVQLGRLAQMVAEDFQLVAEHAELTLRVEIAPELPPVAGSPHYMRRVLDNLLSNAIKFTPAGGTITVRVWRQEEQVTLEVSDTGVGIPPDQLERVFERFYQVNHSIWQRYGGMGLGLALVKETVETYGGYVTVESQVGEGSTFTVTLPIVTNTDFEGK